MRVIIGYRCLCCEHYDTVEFSNIDRKIDRKDIGICMKCKDDSVKEIINVEIILNS